MHICLGKRWLSCLLSLALLVPPQPQALTGGKWLQVEAQDKTQQARAILNAKNNPNSQEYQQYLALKQDKNFLAALTSLSWGSLEQIDFTRLSKAEQEQLVTLVVQYLQAPPLIVDSGQQALWDTSKDYAAQASGVASKSLANMPELEVKHEAWFQDSQLLKGLSPSDPFISRGSCTQTKSSSFSCTQPRKIFAKCIVRPTWQGSNQGQGDITKLPAFFTKNKTCGKQCFQTQVEDQGRKISQTLVLSVIHQVEQMRFTVRLVHGEGKIGVNNQLLAVGKEIDISSLYNYKEQVLTFKVSNLKASVRKVNPYRLEIRGYYTQEQKPTHIDWDLEACPWTRLTQEFTASTKLSIERGYVSLLLNNSNTQAEVAWQAKKQSKTRSQAQSQIQTPNEIKFQIQHQVKPQVRIQEDLYPLKDLQPPKRKQIDIYSLEETQIGQIQILSRITNWLHKLVFLLNHPIKPISSQEALAQVSLSQEQSAFSHSFLAQASMQREQSIDSQDPLLQGYLNLESPTASQNPLAQVSLNQEAPTLFNQTLAREVAEPKQNIPIGAELKPKATTSLSLVQTKTQVQIPVFYSQPTFFKQMFFANSELKHLLSLQESLRQVSLSQIFSTFSPQLLGSSFKQSPTFVSQELVEIAVTSSVRSKDVSAPSSTNTASVGTAYANTADLKAQLEQINDQALPKLYQVKCLGKKIRLPEDQQACVIINGKEYCRIQNPHNPYLGEASFCEQIEISWQYTTQVKATCKQALEQALSKSNITCTLKDKEPIYLQSARDGDPYSLHYAQISKIKGASPELVKGIIGYTYSYQCNQQSVRPNCLDNFVSKQSYEDCPLEVSIKEVPKNFTTQNFATCILGVSCPKYFVQQGDKVIITNKSCQVVEHYQGLLTYRCWKQESFQNTVVTTKSKCAPYTCQAGDMGCDRLQKQQDMSKVIAAVSLLSGIQEESQCDLRTGICRVFAGKAHTCRCSAKGLVDCCNLPTQVSLQDYLSLGFKLTQLNEYAAKSLGYENPIGSWANLGQLVNQGFTKAYNYSKENLTSLYENLVGNSVATGTSVQGGEVVANQKLLQSLMASLYRWVNQNLGTQIGQKIFVQQGDTIKINPAVSQGFNYAMTIYSAYSFTKNALEVAYSCNESEVEFANKRKLRSCTNVGVYCSQRLLGSCIQTTQVSCCYSSPLARIIQEQVRTQLNKGFGRPQKPDCSPLTTEELALVDWQQINLDEWVAIMLSSPEFRNLGTKLAQQQTLLTRASANQNFDQRNAQERNQQRLDYLGSNLTLDNFVRKARQFLINQN
ncbi:conjugal transfer protein TraN [Psittacicella gerlachiana]|uniref:Conjugal transfer mating pair stabilization protein TraN n=1 Tax=Psittacicella gerlachiana TaxID=2028574 RepID=A0A3A1Y677_9GAMM|nr:conjugal transfer protein TraN [Psittacicella gerlachiana]RIY33762.1 hypothetical protein CKF59_06190 [Psittacicella gerlachiana]